MGNRATTGARGKGLLCCKKSKQLFFEKAKKIIWETARPPALAAKVCFVLKRVNNYFLKKQKKYGKMLIFTEEDTVELRELSGCFINLNEVFESLD